MKIVIDDEVCGKSELSFQEVLAVLLVKSCRNIKKLFDKLKKKEVIVEVDPFIYGKSLAVTQRWDDICCNILLTSDNTVPNDTEIGEIAKELIELFPKGKKEGTNIYWRGNVKDISLRLKKFYKLYGRKFKKEDIITATKRYVDSFNGNYSYMRTLKYFIWKDTKKVDAEGKGYIEETSDLATLIENKEDFINNNWTEELK